MPETDEKVNAYIAKSAEFAQPILKYLRQLIHTACPDAEAKIKWGHPHFDYKGGPMCHMAAFKNHCAFGFWKAAIMDDSDGLFAREKEHAMGNLGQLRSLEDLPSDEILIEYIQEAARLNEEGIKISRKKPASEQPKEKSVPDYLETALDANEMARMHFDGFSYAKKKEYIDWLEDAKSETTRNKRLADAIEWISEGKIRNWKYERK